jgi:hypothetical protein
MQCLRECGKASVDFDAMQRVVDGLKDRLRACTTLAPDRGNACRQGPPRAQEGIPKELANGKTPVPEGTGVRYAGRSSTMNWTMKSKTNQRFFPFASSLTFRLPPRLLLYGKNDGKYGENNYRIYKPAATPLE